MNEGLRRVAVAVIEDALHDEVAKLEQAPDDPAVRERVESLRELRVQAITGPSLGSE